MKDKTINNLPSSGEIIATRMNEDKYLEYLDTELSKWFITKKCNLLAEVKLFEKSIMDYHDLIESIKNNCKSPDNLHYLSVYNEGLTNDMNWLKESKWRYEVFIKFASIHGKDL